MAGGSAPLATRHTLHLAFDHLEPSQWKIAVQFYKAHYLEGARLNKAHYLEGARLERPSRTLGDEVFVLRVPAGAHSGAIVAAVRLTFQSAMDATCLHCLAVDRQLRRQGAASQLVAALVDSGVLGTSTCFCFARVHLEEFYRRYGFETVPVTQTNAAAGAGVHRMVLEFFRREQARRPTLVLMVRAADAPGKAAQRNAQPLGPAWARLASSARDAVILEIHSRSTRASPGVVLEIRPSAQLLAPPPPQPSALPLAPPPAPPPVLPPAQLPADARAGTHADTDTERWAACCVARGLGYLATHRARQPHELPCALVEQLALERSALEQLAHGRAREGGAANAANASMGGGQSEGTGQCADGADSADGVDGADGAGAAIDAAIERARPAYEQTYATLPRRLCGGCGQSQRWVCAGCVSQPPDPADCWQDSAAGAGWMQGTPSLEPFRLPFRLEVVLRDEINSSTGLHAATLATPVRVRRFPQGLRSGAPAVGGDEEWIRYDPSTTLVLYPSAGGIGTRELATRIQDVGPTGAGPQQPQRGGCGSTMPEEQQQQQQHQYQQQPRPQHQHQRRLVTVIVVDSKWNNDGAVLGHPSLRGLRHVHLERPPSFSRIWRSNRLAGDRC